MKVLVIGSVGFIGSHVCDRLRAHGHEPIGYDLKDGDDVLDVDRLTKRAQTCEGIIDCAGILGVTETFDHLDYTIDANIKGTLRVLEVARALDLPMVYISLKGLWHNPYMMTKRFGTELCQMFHDYHGLRVAVVRAMNAYGPRQHWGKVRKLVPTFMVAALNNQPLLIHGHGQQSTDFIYVTDVAEVLVRALERQVWGCVFDAGTGVETTVLEVAQLILELTDSSSPIVHVPMRLGEPEDSRECGDIRPMRELLGYTAIVGLREGMLATAAWYREHWRGAEA